MSENKKGRKMSVIVCKFGGTSCANAENIARVEEIVKSNSDRRYIVVSAPGKRHAKDIKVTDLLYTCHDEILQTGRCDSTFYKIEKRFKEIAEGLQIGDITEILQETKRAIERVKSLDFTTSRGEYLNAICIAKRLQLPFIDATEIIFFNAMGGLDEERTYRAIAERVKGVDGAVIPGFYGLDRDGQIKTFSRGGSDISGAILARGIGASVYENWTDVNGFLACDPNIVKNAKKIEQISFKELRELAYMGANVLHEDSTFPLRESDIPIQIKNTFAAEEVGTTILPAKCYQQADSVITGIAGKKDFTIVYIEKDMRHGKIAVVQKILAVLEAENINFEHMPTGIDMLSLVIESKYLKGKAKDRLLEELASRVQPDKLHIVEDIALIATVGHGMQGRAGTAGRILQAIGRAGINVKMIDKCTSELSVIVGVENRYYESAIQAIYNDFFVNNLD